MVFKAFSSFFITSNLKTYMKKIERSGVFSQVSQGQETDGSEEVLEVEDASDPPAFEEKRGVLEAFWELHTHEQGRFEASE